MKIGSNTLTYSTGNLNLRRMESLVRAHTVEDMIAGTIEEAHFTMRRSGGAYRLYASLRCEEMIARMVDAGIFRDDANANN